MDTKIITNPSEQDIDMLARALRNGELVSIPTETVYGLGANGLDPEAVSYTHLPKVAVTATMVSVFLCNMIFPIKRQYNILTIK